MRSDVIICQGPCGTSFSCSIPNGFAGNDFVLMLSFACVNVFINKFSHS